MRPALAAPAAGRAGHDPQSACTPAWSLLLIDPAGRATAHPIMPPTAPVLGDAEGMTGSTGACPPSRDTRP